MKYFIMIFTALLLLSLNACANEQIANKQGEKMNQDDMLMNKPFYTIKIDSANIKVTVTMNGEKVFEDFTTDQKFIEMPVNQWMKSGENKLRVYLLAFEDDNLTISPNAYANVTLKLKEYENFDNKPLTITEIIYDKGQIRNTAKGNYDIIDNKPKNYKDGRITLSEIRKNRVDKSWQTDKAKVIYLEQSITLPTPFPKWKFFDSQTIYEGKENYNIDLTMPLYNKLRQREDIKAFYTVQKSIYDALRNKQVESILPLFKERNEELEIALYKPKGYYEKVLRKDLTNVVNNLDMEALPFIVNDRYFFISDDGKTIYIRNAITFNQKSVSGSEEFKMLFRYQNGKWILTR